MCDFYWLGEKNGMKQQFVPEAERRLRAAGWYPGRCISGSNLERIETIRPLFPKALAVVREFSGLYVEAVGATYMKDGVLQTAGYRRSFCIDPVAAWEDEGGGFYDEYESLLKCKVFPLGFIEYFFQEAPSYDQGRHVYGSDGMFLDEKGRVFAYFYCGVLIGNSFAEAINNLCLETGMLAWDLKNDCPLRLDT